MQQGSSVLCREPSVKDAWMQSSRDPLKVRAMCRALEVSQSGYDEGLPRPPSPHAQTDQVRSERLVEHVEANRHGDGTCRLKDCLADAGKRVRRRRLGRLMADPAVRVNTRRKLKATPDSSPAQVTSQGSPRWRPRCGIATSTSMKPTRLPSVTSRLVL